MLRGLLTALTLAAALAGCVIVGPGVTGAGELLFSGEVVPNDAYQVVVLPQTDRHFRGLRFEAVAYPIEVYRVVLVYRSGAQETFAVSWRFTGGARYRELHIRRDADVREVRMYYRPLDDRRGGGRGRATIRVYGVL